MFVREKLIESLKTGILQITFTKKDGTQRIMECSLKSDLLPKVEPLPEGKTKRIIKENLEVIRVFDLVKKDWRSFRIDSVLDVEVVNPLVV